MYTKEASFSLKEILYFIYMRDDTRCPLTEFPGHFPALFPHGCSWILYQGAGRVKLV